jgi:hypothetical protein
MTRGCLGPGVGESGLSLKFSFAELECATSGAKARFFFLVRDAGLKARSSTAGAVFLGGPVFRGGRGLSLVARSSTVSRCPSLTIGPVRAPLRGGLCLYRRAGSAAPPKIALRIETSAVIGRF